MSRAPSPGRRRAGWKKPVLAAAILAVLGYAAWLAFQLLSYRVYLTGFAAPGQEIEGVYHVHSLHSDGRADVETIARTGIDTGLDFIILTDHGAPNRPSMAAQGWRDGLLLLAGSELSTSRGHLVGLGFEPPEENFSQNAEEALQKINSLGGMGVISHPYYKARWSWGPMDGYAGMDIINGNSLLKSGYGRLLLYLPALALEPKFFLLKLTRLPARELARWDEVNARHNIYGFFSTDAHLLYRPMFSFLRLHLILDRPLSRNFDEARAQVVEALRTGKFYNAVDAAAQARGFRFWGEKDGRRIPMGRAPGYIPPLQLRVKARFDFDVEVRILKDGRVVHSSREKEFLFDVPGPGVYRAEAYLRSRTPLDPRVPWIVSNPIFFREVSP
ncbi:MAG: hypothetical protein FJY83_04680 [Candidatus Aminicenantes bacterium]|nr:hypothetical protein [Candidatus Aminicenantes bacterium]